MPGSSAASVACCAAVRTIRESGMHALKLRGPILFRFLLVFVLYAIT